MHGYKQRATLALLLLQANQVVPTSRLMGALWPHDPPRTARKVIQNTIWGIRKLLRSADSTGDGDPVVLTRSPGYLLAVPTAQIDLYEFRSLMQHGHDRLGAGSPAEAAVAFRAALALWRGDVLADLADAGSTWPETAAIRTARLDVMEDYFEAELSCGRHGAVLDELRAAAEAQPLRERLLYQLVLALYRSGRHTEALDTYQRAQYALAEQLGLEPGQALRELAAGIRRHDPALAWPAGPSAPGALPPAAASPASPAAPAPARPAAVVSTAPLPAADPAGFRAVPEASADVGPVSVVALRVHFDERTSRLHSGEFDAAAERAATVIGEEVDRCGGTVVARTGLLWLAVFAPAAQYDDSPRRAVSAAAAIRYRIALWHPGVYGTSVRAVVTAASTREETGAWPPSVNGPALEYCHRLLPLVPRHGVWVSDEIRTATEPSIRYTAASGVAHAWVATGLYPGGDEDHSVQKIGHHRKADAVARRPDEPPNQTEAVPLRSADAGWRQLSEFLFAVHGAHLGRADTREATDRLADELTRAIHRSLKNLTKMPPAT